ncbi:MAG TPA: aminopeptidase P family protein [Abditibacteriaceae bacterium]|jgi:Xaa-Pro aminopeptidase
MNYSLRIEALRARLKTLECDALVVANATNVRYLAGFTGSSGMCVVTPTRAWFVTDFRYIEQAKSQSAHLELAIADKGLWKEAIALLKKEGATRVGFESEHTSVAALEDIEKEMGARKFSALPVSTRAAVETLRLVKSEEELQTMQRAVDIIDEVFAYICTFLKPGLRESEVADELAFQMRQRGASGPSFTTIVASGARGALPHGVASSKTIDAGDMVTIDMGAIYEGYCSDCTRTVCIGKPTREQQKIYETVWRAQTEASAALRPGLGCKEADAIARRIIEEAGYGDAFGHGLGHGVGLDIHEAPRLSKLGKGKLAVGNVVTSEPGIYLAEWGGVRIEDMLVITKTGARTLTKCAKPRKILAL